MEPSTQHRLTDLPSCFAHGVRNPLNTLSLTIQFLERLLSRETDLRGREDIERHLRTANVEAERIQRLVAAFVDLARVRVPARAPADFAEVARAAIDETRRALANEGALREVEIAAALAPAPVEADARLLREALAAIVRNAVEASPAGARVTASVEPRGAGGGVATVRDTGRGFTASTLARAREPFFTTKDGRLGVGLAHAQAIVAGHGGRLELRNGAAGGAEVVVEIGI